MRVNQFMRGLAHGFLSSLAAVAGSQQPLAFKVAMFTLVALLVCMALPFILAALALVFVARWEEASTRQLRQRYH